MAVDNSLLSWAQANAKNLPQSIADAQKALATGLSRTGQKLTDAQRKSLQAGLAFEQNALSLLSPSKPVAVNQPQQVSADSLMTKPVPASDPGSNNPLVPLQGPAPAAPVYRTPPSLEGPSGDRFTPSANTSGIDSSSSSSPNMAWENWMAQNRAADEAAAERRTAEKIARGEARAIVTAGALQAGAITEAARIQAASAGTRLPSAATTALDLGKNATTEDVMRRRVRRGIASTISEKRTSNPLTQAPTLLGN